MNSILKKISLLFILCLSINTTQAQAPKKMSYQAVIRDASDILLSNTSIGMQISVLKDSASGSVVYTETQVLSTNANGLVSLEIGGGIPVTGTFEGIDWSTGSYFIKIETDPTGGSNYTISGTSQLLSVPYALYADNTSRKGDTAILITGDVTDAEAAAIIANEVGPNTIYVYVVDTTTLTTVDLSSVTTTLIKLKIENNTDLTTVVSNGLEKTIEGFIIKNNPNLSSISFNSFKTAVGDFQVSACENLTNLVFPVLVNGFLNTFSNPFVSIDMPSLIKGGLSVSNTSVTNVNLPVLVSGSITIKGTSMTTISMPSFTFGLCFIQDNLLLTSLSMPLYESGTILISGIYTGSANNLLTSVNLPSYKTGDLQIKYNQILSSISLPVYESGTLQVWSQHSLTSLSLPLYTSGNLFIKFNDITTIDFPSLTNANNVNLQGNKLSSLEVNSILNQMLTITPLDDKIINLKQSPLAPPTGQGITDKATLIGLGNSVTTD